MSGKTKKGRGVFYHKILKSLMISFSIFALISIGIFTVVLKQISMVEKESDRSAYVNQLNSLNIAEMSLSQMLSAVDTYSLDSWVDSSVDDNYRYYHALQLYSWLSKNNGSLGDTIYRTALISRSDDKMVITPTGSCSLDYYLATFANLSESDAAVLKANIENKYASAFSFSSYDDKGMITDAYIARPYLTDSGGYAVIFSRFYLSRFLALQDNEHSALVGTDGQLLWGSFDSAESVEFRSAVEAFIADHDGLDEGRYHISPLVSHQWYFISYFEPQNSILIYLIVWIAMIVSFTILLHFLVFRQAQRLYSPFSEALSGGDPDLVIGKNTDEIDLLIKKNDEIRTLLEKLNSANETMELYNEIRENRNLLDGTASCDEASPATYYVAEVSFSGSGEHNVDFLSFQLALNSYKDKGISYVPYGNDRIAIIIRTENYDAKAILLELLHSCSDESDITAVLSNPVKGRGMLHSGYEECNRLLGYSSSLRSYRIITADDISGLNIRDDFSYSSEDEAFLLKLIISGNPQASEELDEICSRNSDGLSYEARYNFALCLVSTLSRLFSELRKSSEEIIGYDADIPGIMAERAPDRIIERTAAVFRAVISSVCNSRSESDCQMISMMKRYIHENYMNNIGLQNMADKFNITPKYCGMIFSRLSSDNFKNYLNQYRIEESKKIIESNPSIKVQNLASMVGFNSPNTFIRVFSKYTGVTPKSYADTVAFSKN